MEEGNVRETFVLNQLTVNHHVVYTQTGNFLVDDKWLLEMGGKSKSRRQITGIPKAFVVSDEME